MYKVVGGNDLKSGHLISFDKLNVLDDFKLDNSKFAGISNPAEHRTEVSKAIACMEKSGNVGAALAIFVKSSTNLEIVCWPGVPGEFLCVEEATKLSRDLSAPTIMWDPYTTFSYFGRIEKGGSVSTKIADTAKLWGGTKEKDKSTVKFQTAVMPAWVVLAHEIGHYYHYVNKKSWFTKCLGETGGIAAIEAENLKDHEQPILKDINKPVRQSYQDFKGGSNDKHITWPVGVPNPAECSRQSTTIVSSLAAFNRELEEAKRKKGERDNRFRTKVPTPKRTIDLSKFANLP